MSEAKYLTKEGLEKIKAELEQLKTVKRKEIADRIAEAMKLGDLSENAEYQEAKDEQGANESRVMELEDIVKTAIVIEEALDKKVVSVGSTVTVKGPTATKEYTIVGSSEANPMKGFISNESPLGEAFLGCKVGETLEVDAPAGKIKYKISEIK